MNKSNLITMAIGLAFGIGFVLGSWGMYGQAFDCGRQRGYFDVVMDDGMGAHFTQMREERKRGDDIWADLPGDETHKRWWLEEINNWE